VDGAAFSACTSPLTINVAAGSHSFAVRSTDAAGNVDATSATYTWTVQGDVIPPAANPVPTPAANANGWNRTNVTVTWNWTDSGSGINTSQCVTQTTSAGQGTLTLSATCQDLAGNLGTASVQVRVDKTAPTLAPSVSPAKILLNGTGTASAGGSDLLSGVASQGCDPLVTSTVGTKTVTCTVFDAAGNKATAKATYREVYGFAGFASPVANQPTLNLLRATAIVPLRWRLVDANGAAVTNLKSAAVTSPIIACPGSVPQRISVFATSTQLTNLGNGNYQLGWKPAKSDVGKCRQLNLSIGDGEAYPALFRFD
jgi:hypothetical protein